MKTKLLIARLAMCILLGVVLLLEYVLATWLVLDGIFDPNGPLGANTLPPQVNVMRTALLGAIAFAAIGLHFMGRKNAEC